MWLVEIPVCGCREELCDWWSFLWLYEESVCVCGLGRFLFLWLWKIVVVV